MKNTNRSINRIGKTLGLLAGGFLLGCTTYIRQPYEARADEPSSVEIHAESDFYEPLSSYGRWEVVGSYGRCWIPGHVDAGWRPYCNGNWQRTDAGWYWASEEPWGWATYHYGRWDLSAEFGWYWVPQTQWAPAWVSWHEGGGYIGWAPLYPTSRFRGDSVEVDVRIISPRAYVFVEERQFLSPVRPTTVVVNNTTIINKTVNITKIKVVNKTVINEGPHTTVIEQASGRKLQVVPVRQLRSQEEAPVVAKHSTPSSLKRTTAEPTVRSQTVEPTVRSHDEKAMPVREVNPVARPQMATPEPPAVKAEDHQADEQKHHSQANEEKRIQQEKARVTETEKVKSAPAPANAKPESEHRGELQREQAPKPVDRPEPKAPPVTESRGKSEPAEKEKGRHNNNKEDHKKKDQEEPAQSEHPEPAPQPASLR